MASSVGGLLATGMGTFAWGFAAIFVKLASLSGLALPFYRLWAGFLLMLVVALAVRRRLRRGAGWRAGWRAEWRDLRRVLWASVPGGVFFGADVMLFFTALKNTSVANATFIGALQPILVMLAAAPLFGERLTRRQLGWTAVALAGVAGVVLGGAGGFGGLRLGDVLAVGALLAWTGYWLASKHVRARLTTVEYMTGLFLVASVLVTPLALVAGGGVIAVQRPLDWLWIGLLGLIPGTGHFLFNWAHGYVPATISSLVQAAVPVVATAAAFVILGEPLAGTEILGGVVAVVAIGVVCAASARTAPPAAGRETPP